MRSTLGPALLALAVSFAAPGRPAAEQLEEREKAHLFPRSTYAWPFATGPVYGDVDASRWSEPGVLHTMVGSFDLKRGSPALPAELRAGAQSRYAILQVDPAAYADGRFDHIRELLESHGGALLEAMAVGAYLIRANPPLRASLPAQDGVLAVEPYHPAFKLAPTIGRVPLTDPLQALSEVYRLEAVVFRGEDAQQVASSLKALGAAITRVDLDAVFFELSAERLADVARLQAVKAVFESLPNVMHGQQAAATLQTGSLYGGLPYNDAGVRGDGNGGPGTSPQILMVLDSGLQLDNGDLSDTRTSAGTAGPSHRKVLLYTTAVGGAGDALGCDAGPQGGFTHGHAVSVLAVGNASSVPPAYGPGWPAPGGWRLDGVAPRAKLILYDAQVTPGTLSCADPMQNTLSVGTLYTDDTPGSGSLGDAHARGARVSNFSWGTVDNSVYGTNAQRIDQFLFDQPDAMVFLSAGDDRDSGSISDPATCKSCAVVGKSRTDFFWLSSSGPVGSANRNGVLLTAYPSDTTCRSNDNDQNDPVECDVLEVDDTLRGTSYSAASASGAALLVRDWFQQGFYPDGTSADPGNAADQVPIISGALLKAVLVTSADFGPFEYFPYNRFNPRTGYGYLELKHALPLSTYAPSPTGMVVADGGLTSGGRLDIPGLPGSIDPAGTTQSGTLRIESDRRELRCALAWTEDAGDALAHDLDLEMVSPSGKVYIGNFFTEDVDYDFVLDAGENCIDRGAANTIDSGGWSIPINACGVIAGSRRDLWNPTEGIFLSPDPVGDGIDQGTDNQIEVGDWTINVVYRTGTGSQRYAVSCSGPLATGSSVRFDQASYVCADEVRLTVQETSDPSDPAPSAAEVASRTTVQVLDGNGVVRDSETGLGFTAFGLRFESAPIFVTSATAYDPGNGVLDARQGDRLKVIYTDETGGASDPSKLRINAAEIACRSRIVASSIARFGRDAADLIQGGCERDARGLFTFGFPDQHMDAGEVLAYQVAFETQDGATMRDVEVSLRCVQVDANSPADCPPGSAACADPDRLDNPPCADLTIIDSPHVLPVMMHPFFGTTTASFTVQMASAIVGTPKVEMLLGVTAPQVGKSSPTLLVFRHVLDADDVDTFYSTDYPTGGTEVRDFNGNETLQNPITDPTDPDQDYLFETRTYGDLTAGGTRNTALQSPWNFDANDGGFKVGLNPTADDVSAQTIANWGEDKNFNGVLDPGEDRDPVNGVLDRGWNTKGGCGWQTRGSNPTGGIWHTGTIDDTSLGCNDQCELADVSASGVQWELLLTPVIQKVHPGLDADGDRTHRVAITNWAWNATLDLRYGTFTWELDLDTQTLGSDNPFDDLPLSRNRENYSPFPPTGVRVPGPVFAPFAGSSSVNGTAGNNRVGKNACIFETGPHQPNNVLGFARPADDDLDNDGDSLIDEYVTPNGPIRNFDIVSFHDGTYVPGPLELRYDTLEDLLGDAGNSFQGALGFGEEGQGGSYGVGVDDMVLEWKEISVVKDATDCTGSACATLSLDSTNAYEGSGVVTVTVIDASPWEPAHPGNDCNGDGDYVDPGDDQDCNDNGTLDVTVRASSPGEPSGEVFVLDRTEPGGSRWKGDVPFSAAVDVPGVLYLVAPFMITSGSTEATVRYEDRDDGTGQRCPNAADPALRGFLEATTRINSGPGARISVSGMRLTDNGDNDGFADPNETVSMFVTLHNNSTIARNNVVLRLSSNDPSVDCILGPVVAFGSLAAHETRASTEAFTFRVANVSRSSTDTELSAAFSVAISGSDFDTALRTQRVTVDLDLNVSGGLLPTNYTEGFEGAGLGTFTTQSLDVGRESLAASDGHRCQYNDPDFVNSNSYGSTQCFLGGDSPAQNGYDWHVHGLSSPDGGRAYLGNNALHWGVHPGAASSDTTRLRQLDAIRTTLPVNLGWNGVRSELSFKHQVGLVDTQYISGPNGYAVDRGVVHVQLANSAAQAVGNWTKISPYENLYESVGLDQYSNCMFDPTDDGNTEDDYFDPTDPNRRLGPSSTCGPEFVFSREGSIFWSSIFDPAAITLATDGPGLQGSRGPGTWVESKFSLDRWRARRLRFRFLVTSMEIAFCGSTWASCVSFSPTPSPADDGWYIDDIRVTNTLTSAATLSVDTADRTGLPGCGPACTSVNGSLTASPPATAAPGQLVQLDASASFTDRCADGILQFRFWEDRNGNSVPGDAGDVLVRTWSEDPIVAQAPSLTTRYGVEVRCSSLPSCQASTTTLVTVPCPGTGNAIVPFAQAIGFTGKTQVTWASAALVDVVRGDLGALRSGGGQFNGTVEACLGNDVNVSGVTDATTPGPGLAKFYLVRGAGPSPFCNAGHSWKTGVLAEKPGVGGDRDDDIVLDPEACP